MTLASRDLGFPRVMCHRFAYAFLLCHTFVTLTFSRLCLLLILFGYYDSSLSRAGSSYAQSSVRLLTLTQLDVIRVSYVYGSYARLYLYFPYLYIYWVGDGTIPHLQSTLQPP